MRIQLGSAEILCSPVTIMKSFVGAASWYVRGSPEELDEYRRFRADFFPYLMAQPDDQDLYDFCDAAIAEVDAVKQRHGLESDLLFHFGWKLKNTLVSYRNRDAVLDFADEYGEWLASWVDGPWGELACQAVAQAEAWGLTPFRPTLCAVRSFGDAIYGKYVSFLQAVCLQLDVIRNRGDAELCFIETMLHEQVHAVIHRQMGDDPERRELRWFEELTAVLTSQSAIRNAARRHSDALRRDVVQVLARLRRQQRYGDLANAVLRDARHPLIPWMAWQAIFALPPDERRDYAVGEVIEPILQRLGWPVCFPYHYGDLVVTCFAHRS